MSSDTRNGDSNDDVNSQAPTEPTIPDGGLGEAMPEWLRRPPAWRGMPVPDFSQYGDASPDTDAVAVGSAPGVEPDLEVTPEDEVASRGANQTVRSPRTVPTPDSSLIDPSTLIELSDLPPWLVGLGKRDIPAESPSQAAPALHDVNADEPDRDRTDASSVPLPPFLREEPSVDIGSEASTADGETPVLGGISRRILALGGVLLVVIAIAVLLSVFG